MFTLPQLTAKGRAVDTLSHGEGYSSTEDSAISSDHHLSRHPSTDSLDRFTMADQSKTSGIYPPHSPFPMIIDTSQSSTKPLLPNLTRFTAFASMNTANNKRNSRLNSWVQWGWKAFNSRMVSSLKERIFLLFFLFFSNLFFFSWRMKKNLFIKALLFILISCLILQRIPVDLFRLKSTRISASSVAGHPSD